MHSITIKSIRLTNFKKHRSLFVEFDQGTNMIVGPNYKGKTTVLQAILVALFGSSALSIASTDLPTYGTTDFKVELELSDGHTITRTLKNATMARAGEGPHVRGHSSVTKSVCELLGLDRAVFSKVFLAGQGSTERLLNMEGAELQRFLESLVGIDKLDLAIKEINRRVLYLQGQMSGVADAVLGAEELAQVQSELARQESIASSALAEIGRWNEQLTELSRQRSEVEADYEKARELEQLWVAHERAVAELQAKLEGMSQWVVPHKGAVEENLANAEASLQAIRESNRLQAENNAAWESYQARYDALQETVAGLELTPEDALQSSKERLQDLKTSMQEWRNQMSDYKSVEKQRTAIEATLSKLRSSLPDKPASVLVADYELVLESLNASITRLKTELSGVQSALHNATCPTCKRDMEGVDRKALEESDKQLSAELATARAEYQTLSTAADEWAQYNAKTAEILKLEKDLAALGDPVGPDPVQFEEWEKEYDAIDVALNLSLRNNKLIEDTRAKLAALVPPKTPACYVFQDDENQAQLVADCRAAYQRVKADIEASEANNRLYRKLIAALNDELSRKPTERYDVEALRTKLLKINEEFGPLHDSLTTVRDQKHTADLALQPLRQKLDQHEQVSRVLSDWGSKAENYKRIAEIVTNSRSKFVEYARHSVFGVTAEFCKLATNGDMEDVKFDEVIMFQENGRWVKSALASGAQRALLGLGMMFGISTLVKTPWETMLFDEAGAAMSDSISMGASLAMQSLCKQSISITHRQLDVAGKVIEV